MRVRVGLVALGVSAFSTLAYAQSSGGAGAGGGAGSAAGAGSGSTAAGSMSTPGSVNGTGGSPGPNTSNALSHGTTGSRLGNTANERKNSGPSSAASGFVNDSTMNNAVQDLGNAKTGIIPGH
jgi:hypothetical protein